MSGSVIVLTGPPGAGKSTIARVLAGTYPRAVHLHADDFWHAIVSGGIPPYLPASDAQNQVVVDAVARAAVTYARGGYTVVVDGIVGPWMLGHYRRALRHHPGVELQYVVLRPDRATALARARQRTDPGALVDEGPILALWDQFADLGVLDGHTVDSTGHREDETLRAVQDALAGGRYRLAHDAGSPQDPATGPEDDRDEVHHAPRGGVEDALLLGERRTARLLLRRLLPGDEAAVLAYRSDAHASRYLGHGPMEPGRYAGWLAERATGWPLEHPGDRRFYAVVESASGRVVGDAVLVRAAEGLQSELGMFLHPETSGLGYSLEAGRALLGIAFDELAWHRIVARADADNRSSVRAIEKLGLRREGLFVEGTPRGDTWADTVQYALLAREWAASDA